ncbi:Ubiquitin fusion degradation protein 4, partial [Massospora cicadina]
QSTVASSERPDSANIVAAVGSTRPRREDSIVLDPSHLIEIWSEKAKPEAAHLRTSHVKERGLAKQSFDLEFDYTSNNAPGTSSSVRTKSLVATLIRVIKGSFGILDEVSDCLILACRCLCNLLEVSPTSIEIIKASEAVKIIIPYLQYLRFLSGLIWASPGSLYTVRALQVLVVLLEKAPSIYTTVLVWEGVLAAIVKLCIEMQAMDSIIEANPLLCSLEGIWTFFSHIKASVVSKVNINACKRVCAILAQAMNVKLSSMKGLCPKELKDLLREEDIERQKLFFDLFLTNDFHACQNLVQHLNTHLEQIESYPLLLIPQDEPAVSRLLQLCQLRVTESKGFPAHTEVMPVKLMDSFSLVAEHICRVVPALKTGPEVEFYIKDCHLDGTGTVLKALLRAGLPLDSLKAGGDPISITYCRITTKPSRCGTSDANPVDEEKEYDTILRVLKVVHMMANWWTFTRVFINERLMGKLDRQLQEAALVVGKCLPAWCEHLITSFPFLFPFMTRLEYFQATALGSNRHITKHMLAEAQREDVGSLGQLAKRKVLVSRNRIIESAVELAASRPQDWAILETQFCDEVGSGQGSTLVYFSCVFQEFCKRSLSLWREACPSDSEFVSLQCGLFPKPSVPSNSELPREWAVQQQFRTLGWITAKSLFDSRITDLLLSEAFLKLLVGGAKKLERLSSLRLVRSFDHILANSLASVIKSGSDGTIDSLALSFKLPGTQLDNQENFDTFIDATLDFLTDTGVHYAITAFKEGFNKLFSLQKLAIFTPRELTTIFGNGEENWSAKVIFSSIKAEHGYTSERWGVYALTVASFCALTPNLTIVRKHCEPPLCPDNYLLSVNTCFNYLKLPDYSCEEVMRESFLTAMKEGNLFFHLS